MRFKAPEEITPPPPPPLPGVAGEIEEVLGRAQTVRLIMAMRDATRRSWRVCFYVPKTLRIDHDLVRILGWNDARRLCHAFGGEILQTSNLNFIYRAFRTWAVHHLAAQYPPAVIADLLGIEASGVGKILKGKPPEGKSHLHAQYGFGDVA
ncbi:hypothetical protein WNY61_09220 [Sulfitobacter sp. AS92]|uniref:hypothetical protein n=1 Tax=Sulfitobacter sp. AS92 TaxID=3135783 RepID=UPI00317E9BC7